MIVLLLSLLAHADEGMWLPEQLPEIGPAWQEKGLEIAPEALADPLAEPLGSIVSLGFCSASFVSPDGLVATNHHCVEGYLQVNSTGERNLHKDGFVAPKLEDEISAGPAARLWVVDEITDVTDQVLAKVKRRTKDGVRYERVEQAKKRLIAACEREPNRRCRVATYRGGAEYRLIRSLEIQDVRLVMAPPMSVGQFGGDVDNWMWPRHGADFSFLRAYVAPDGSSAPFSTENVPYKPAHHLQVDPTGAEPDSFVMVAGYPGRTSRHARAVTLDWYANRYLPVSLELMRAVHDTLVGFAESDPEAAARLGRPISGLANGIKNSDGLLEGLDHGDLIAAKAAREQELLDWVDADATRKKQWRADLDAHVALLEEDQADAMQRLYVGWLGRGADLLSVARTAVRLAEERELPDIERDRGFQDRDVERIRARFQQMDRTLHLPSDEAVFRDLLARYQALPEPQRVAEIDAWIAEKGGTDAAVKALYGAPALAGAEARLALLDMDSEALAASDDPWVQLARVFVAWEEPIRERDEAVSGAKLRVQPTWYAALEAWNAEQGKVLYDDANGTLRLTLGHVKGYSPQDGLLALPQTTLGGFAAKAGEAPFDAPSSFVERAAAEADHPMNFLSTLDITGGNSGSAVLDGKGRFVGLAFDGNYESIAADWIFLPGITRCISVDVRAIQWVLEGTSGAERLLSELGLSQVASTQD